MEQITLRLPVRTLAELERDARDAGRSRSEHMRDILASHQDVPADAPDPERVHELEEEIAELQGRIEYLENQNKVLTDAYQVNQETTALVKRRKDKEDASITERARWWLFGRD